MTAAVVLFLSGCATYQVNAPTTSAPAETAAEPAPGTVTCTYRSGGAPAVPVDPPVTENVPATGTELVELTIGGETVSITVNLPAGEYTFFCSVPGHRAAGMVGTLIVK